MLQLVDHDCAGGLRTLLPADGGHVNTGFSERQPVQFHSPGQGGFELFIDDEPLAARRVRGLECWTWTPGFYAGTVRADLHVSGEATPRVYLLDVAPEPEKLGQDAFRALINDILAADPSLLLGVEPATTGAGGTGSDDTLHLKYAMLFQYGPRLLSALCAIQDRPRRRLVGQRVVVPLNRVRRPDTHTVLIMARNGSLSCLVATATRSILPADQHGWRLNIPQSSESLDCAATRCLTALVRAVLLRARQIHGALEMELTEDDSSKFRTGLATRLPRRLSFLDSLADDLERFLSEDPFAVATREELSAGGLTAIAADPGYARAQRLTWEILRPRTASLACDAWTWMSPTWDIFERWCFVRLSEALQQRFPDLSWSFHRVAGSDRCLEGVTPNQRVRLLWQPLFQRNAGSGSFQSISETLRPDFAVTVDQGDSHRLLVFDAKYSHVRYSVVAAMRSAHVYHDALRYFGRPPEYSLLLLPSPGSELDWLHDPAFKAAHGVGVLTCSPDAAYRSALATELGAIMRLEEAADCTVR